MTLACKNKLSLVALELIKTKKCSLGHQDKDGNTALILACHTKMEKVARELIQTCKSNPGATNNRGSTALIVSCIKGLEDIALELLATGESNPLVKNDQHEDAYQIAVENKLHRIVAKINSFHTDRKTRIQSHTKILYHQTSKDNAIRILLEGKMNRGINGMCGGGIYFAETAEATHYKAHQKGSILKCQVKLGNICPQVHPNTTYEYLLQQGYDSVKIGSTRSGTEYVVFNGDQVKILDVI